ncbi:MAG: hypothetical protein LLG14_23970 [Nocardiaceae bacterium]|nr:hypothetical protein [Nocardiaceae bacterium]
MATHVYTHNPVRSDVDRLHHDEPRPSQSRRWALAGVGAGVFGIATIVTSTMIDAIYDKSLHGDDVAISEKLSQQVPQMLGMHVSGMLSAVLMIVFAAGLYRRMRSASDSIAPLVGFAGLLGTAVVLVLGTGLDTEFLFGVGNPEYVAPENAALYNHWVGTIPWVWALSGLTGIALHVVSRRGVAPRWIGLVGLIGGGLTLLLGISPLQYMAGFTGPVVLLTVALGFLLGDKIRAA